MDLTGHSNRPLDAAVDKAEKNSAHAKKLSQAARIRRDAVLASVQKFVDAAADGQNDQLNCGGDECGYVNSGPLGCPSQ